MGIGNWELGIGNQRLSTDSESETGFLSISGFQQQSLSRNPVSLVVRNRVSINLWFSATVSQQKPGFFPKIPLTTFELLLINYPDWGETAQRRFEGFIGYPEDV
ncbi:MAG: hypothetical protein WBL95_01405 [Microcoleus sp.]